MFVLQTCWTLEWNDREDRSLQGGSGCDHIILMVKEQIPRPSFKQPLNAQLAGYLLKRSTAPVCPVTKTLHSIDPLDKQKVT